MSPMDSICTCCIPCFGHPHLSLPWNLPPESVHFICNVIQDRESRLWLLQGGYHQVITTHITKPEEIRVVPIGWGMAPRPELVGTQERVKRPLVVHWVRSSATGLGLCSHRNFGTIHTAQLWNHVFHLWHGCQFEPSGNMWERECYDKFDSFE